MKSILEDYIMSDSLTSSQQAVDPHVISEYQGSILICSILCISVPLNPKYNYYIMWKYRGEMLAFAVLKTDLTLPLISLHAALSCLLQILLPGFSICVAMFVFYMWHFNKTYLFCWYFSYCLVRK